MIKLYGNPYSWANRVCWTLDASATNEQVEVLCSLTKCFTIADLIVSEVLTNLIHTGMGLQPFPVVNNDLKMKLLQASAKKAFTADIAQPYLTAR